MNFRRFAAVLLTPATLIWTGCQQSDSQAARNPAGEVRKDPPTATARGPKGGSLGRRWKLKSSKDRDGNVVELQVFKVGDDQPYQRLSGFSASPSKISRTVS